jgi:hypothetical protein
MKEDPTRGWTFPILFRINVARGNAGRAAKEARRLLRCDVSPASALHMLLRYYLGELPLSTLKNHREWHEFDIATRGFEPSSLPSE